MWCRAGACEIMKDRTRNETKRKCLLGKTRGGFPGCMGRLYGIYRHVCVRVCVYFGGGRGTRPLLQSETVDSTSAWWFVFLSITELCVCVCVCNE